MKAAIFVKPGLIEPQERPMPELVHPGDAIIRVVRTCVCGSDLWWYRGVHDKDASSPIGHEGIGVVERVGSDVKNVQAGDFVIMPFTHGCGHCATCRAGFEGNCLNPVTDGIEMGFQAQYTRYTNADWSLVKIPGQPSDYSDEQLNDLLTLSDVMATGYHAAASAEVKPGDTVVVMGDGAVGLCGIIAAKLRGAARIIAMSSHADRQVLATEFGATDIVAERGEAAVAHVLALTDGAGADAVLECVGTELSTDTAVKVARPGAVVGRVGIPDTPEMNTNNLWWRNVGLRGGLASVTTYDRAELLDAVLKGEIHPGRVFTSQFKLDDIQAAYEAMDQRQTVKALVVMD
ncbi:MAG: zinc-dependent alcohol dehydrogenase family protein [Lacticaseibacillus songhuajiangensis]|jgi:alcohol dehydrogenase|nr:zinc-dependent alcohol dehydrogenase family protein [Lacticaseibacillus songhuajiangensis]